jgi:hypothetical protein
VQPVFHTLGLLSPGVSILELVAAVRRGSANPTAFAHLAVCLIRQNLLYEGQLSIYQFSPLEESTEAMVSPVDLWVPYALNIRVSLWHVYRGPL